VSGRLGSSERVHRFAQREWPPARDEPGSIASASRRLALVAWRIALLVLPRYDQADACPWDDSILRSHWGEAERYTEVIKASANWKPWWTGEIDRSARQISAWLHANYCVRHSRIWGCAAIAHACLEARWRPMKRDKWLGAE
jgi:hypothetical protein